MKLLFVFGTRPEAIKLAPVFLELSGRSSFDCKICVTGQHREMLTQVLELFELRPDWNLDVMRPDQDLAYLTGAVLSGVSGVLDRWRPERVIVQGDTTSTFAGALVVAAIYTGFDEGPDNWQSLWTCAIYVLLAATLWRARAVQIPK